MIVPFGNLLPKLLVTELKISIVFIKQGTNSFNYKTNYERIKMSDN